MKKTILVITALFGLIGGANAQQIAYGLNSTTNTLSIFSLTSGVTSSTVAISGTSVGESIAAIDFRPFNSTLYGYSTNNRLFTINAATGAASLFSDLSSLTPVTPTSGALGSNIASTFPPNGAVTIDVNPTVTPGGFPANSGALRIIDSSGGNFRYVFDTNVLNLDDTFVTGAQIIGAAYINNDTDSGTGTTLYVINAADNSLYTVNPPNDAVVNLVGALGLTISGPVGFDVPVGSLTDAFASINGSLYNINLGSGLASQIGTVGALTGINDIAVIPEPSTYAMIFVGALGLFLVHRRATRPQLLPVR